MDSTLPFSLTIYIFYLTAYLVLVSLVLFLSFRLVILQSMSPSFTPLASYYSKDFTLPFSLTIFPILALLSHLFHFLSSTPTPAPLSL